MIVEKHLGSLSLLANDAADLQADEVVLRDPVTGELVGGGLLSAGTIPASPPSGYSGTNIQALIDELAASGGGGGGNTVGLLDGGSATTVSNDQAALDLGSATVSFIELQLRRDTAVDWTNANPVLAEGELALEQGTNRLKAGDGTTAWNGLPYITASGAGGGTLDQGTSFYDIPNDYLYIVFGVDENWEAVRYRNTDETTGAGQTGPAPTDLVTLQGLTYS